MGRKSDFVAKANLVIKLVEETTGISDITSIRRIIRKIITNSQRPEREKDMRTMLRPNEKVVAQILINMKVSPYAAYTWFRLMGCPEEVLERVRCGEIGYNDALKIYSTNIQERKNPSFRRNFLKEVSNLVGGVLNA